MASSCTGFRFRPLTTQGELAPPQRRPPGFTPSKLQEVEEDDGLSCGTNGWEPGKSPALEQWVKELVDQRVDLMEVRANLVKAEISEVIRSSIVSTVDKCLLKQRLEHIQPMGERLLALEEAQAIAPHLPAGGHAELQPSSPESPPEALPQDALAEHPPKDAPEAPPETSPEARGDPHERIDALMADAFGADRWRRASEEAHAEPLLDQCLAGRLAVEVEPLSRRLALLSDDVAPLAGRVAALEAQLQALTRRALSKAAIAERVDSRGTLKSSKPSSGRRCFKLCDGRIRKGKQCFSLREFDPTSCREVLDGGREAGREASTTKKNATERGDARRGRQLEEYRNFVSATVTVVKTSLLVSDPAGPDSADVVTLDEAPSIPRRSSQEFRTVLTKTPGQPLGFQLASEGPDGTRLQVASIVEGGVLDEWNTRNPTSRVAAGYRIVEVNGARVEPKIRDALAVRGGQLVMVVQRPAGWEQLTLPKG